MSSRRTYTMNSKIARHTLCALLCKNMEKNRKEQRELAQQMHSMGMDAQQNNLHSIHSAENSDHIFCTSHKHWTSTSKEPFPRYKIAVGHQPISKQLIAQNVMCLVLLSEQ